jgi:hypothetical protein
VGVVVVGVDRQRQLGAAQRLGLRELLIPPIVS